MIKPINAKAISDIPIATIVDVAMFILCLGVALRNCLIPKNTHRWGCVKDLRKDFSSPRKRAIRPHGYCIGGYMLSCHFEDSKP